MVNNVSQGSDPTSGSDSARRRSIAAPRRRQIIYSTSSTEVIKRLVVRQYTLTGPINCVLYQRGVNDIYLLSSDEGKFAFRVSRCRWRTEAAVLAELHAIRYLHEKGARVAEPILRRDGRLVTLIAAPEGKRPAVMFRWADGRAPKYTEANDAFCYGKALAELHNASDDMAGDPDRPRMDIDYLLKRPLKLISSRLTGMPKITQQLALLVERIGRQASEVLAGLDDWGFCHGDIYSNNARIVGERVVLFDFDACCAGWRLFDLATYRWEARRHGEDNVAWPPFIEGYLSCRPTAVASLRSLGLFMILRHLWTTEQWILLSAEDGIGELPDEFFEALVPFCEGIEADHAKGWD